MSDVLPNIDWINQFQVILASQSPRRKQLLEGLGLRFSVVTADVEETHPDLPKDPPVLAQRLAHIKAEAVQSKHPGSVIVAADTVVAWHGHAIGKPESPEDAVKILRKLSDHQHQVYTGIAILMPGQGTSHLSVEQTDVRFRHLTEEEIGLYVKTGSPMDKAGAYGIQDPMISTFIMGIRGDYYNVVGFPLRRFYELLGDIRFPGR